jgi:hypothetical protein
MKGLECDRCNRPMKAQHQFHCATCEMEEKRIAVELAAIRREQQRAENIRRRELVRARLYMVEIGVAEYDPEKVLSMYRLRAANAAESHEETLKDDAQ